MAASGITDPALKEAFTNFAKFGDNRSDGKTITLKNADKWMKQAEVIDGKKITTTDTGIIFNKMKSRTLSYPEFITYVDELAKYKKSNSQEMKLKLTKCGFPGTTKTTEVLRVGAVDRLTDPTKYTGSHKERFDESGKGKGKAGREDLADDKGYVTGYANADTYDKTHPQQE